MNEELKKNVETQIAMLREISRYSQELELANQSEQKLLLGAIKSLRTGIKIINSSLPRLLKEVGASKSLPSRIGSKDRGAERKDLEEVRYQGTDSDYNVVLKSKDKEKFLKELSISESLINKVKKRKKISEKYQEFTGARGVLKWANRFFLKSASEHVRRGGFRSLSVALKKANLDILFESYVALIYFSVFLSVFLSTILAVVLLFVNFSFSWPFVSSYSGEYLLRFVKVFWIPLVIPLLTFLAVYFYPSAERKAIGRKIDQELPFAVIHMSAVSGSGIEPSEIFKIVGMSQDYPNLKKEVRKVLNQINLYGYDLVTALNNAAKSAPSEKLGELFAGFSTTITSGASLQDFLEKRSETLLLSYRLEREKYTRLIETFLDIYISVVIAAPMVFLLLLILMSISGIQAGLGSTQISILAVSTIILLNVIFLAFLQVKQPPY